MKGPLLALVFPWICASYTYYGPETAERFPLAGGLRHGMEVKVSVQGYAVNDSKFEFVSAKGEVIFQFMLLPDMKMIKRGNDSKTYNFGGWPLGVNASSHTFKFLMSGKRLMTFIDDVFSPWFDCDELSEPVTHLWVFSGFHEVEVTLQQPPCETSCSVDECTDRFGRNLCMDKNGTQVNASECKAAVTSNGVPTACSTMASESTSACCLGTASPLSQASVEQLEYNYFEIVGDMDRVTRGCKAFNITPCPFKAQQLFSCSHFNSDGTTLCVWKGQPDAMVPLSILKPVTIKTYNYTLDKDQMTATKLQYGWDFETYVTESSVSGLQGLYAFVMHQRGKGLYEDPWVHVIEDRYNYWKSPDCADCTPGTNVLATNIPNPIAVKCTDLIPPGKELWKDLKNRSCDDYKNQTLCDTKGKPDPSNWKDGDNLYDKSVLGPGMLGSPVVCCACGGGSLGGTRLALPVYMDDLLVISK